MSTPTPLPAEGPNALLRAGGTLRSLAGHRILRPGTVGLTIFAAVYELVRRLPDTAEARRFFTNAGQLPVSFVVVLLSFALRSRLRSDDRDRRGFKLIQIAMIALFLGDVAHFVVENFGASAFPVAWARAVYASGVPFLAAGLFLLCGRVERGIERLRVVLDVLTVMTTAFVLSAHYLVRPLVVAGDADVWALVRPLGALVTVLAVSTLVLRRPPDVPRCVLAWLGVAVFTGYLGDGVDHALAITGIGDAPGLDGTLRLAIAIAFAAAIESRAVVDAGRHGVGGRDEAESRLRLHPLPYAATAVAYAVLIAECWSAHSLASWDLAVGTAAATIALVARQVLAVRENATLWRERAQLLGDARLSALVRHATDAIWILDTDGRVRWASPSSLAVAGRRPEELVGWTFADAFGATDREWAKSLLAQALATPREPVKGDGRLGVPGRPEACIELTFTNLLDEPNVGGVVANLHDVTTHARLEEELSRQAFHDGLTGLSNRSLFQDRVEHALARCLRSGRGMAICLVDLDHFKTVNDGLGHSAGDTLLVEVARRLRLQMRDVDTTARIGGDEFAILVEDLDGTASATALSERAASVFRAPFTVDGHEVRVTASVGIAFARPSDDCEAMLRNADTAMYVAKARGRDTTVIFEESMHEEARESLELNNDLRRVIERGEIDVHHQPIVRLSDGEITGFEALARWTHPTRGPIPPSRFIPLAESSGLIAALGRIVLAKAMREIRAADARRPGATPAMLFINVSALQLEDETFVPWLRAEAESADFDPRRLCIELTESVFVHRTEHVKAPLEALRALGMLVGIDDFGTGYSSLSYLHRFPLDVLKIPREFVERLDKSDDSILANSIVALAAAMNLRTVGEGIETAEQLRALRELGCELGQGYHLARPGPIGAVLDSIHTIRQKYEALALAK